MLLGNSKTNGIKIVLDNNNVSKMLLGNSKTDGIKIMLDNSKTNRIEIMLGNNSVNRVNNAVLNERSSNRLKLVLDSKKQLNSYSKMTFFHENRQLCVYLIQHFFLILIILISFYSFQCVHILK
jgi:hypothetical protein